MPFVAATLPFTYVWRGWIFDNAFSIIMLLAFIVSTLMLVYLFFDMVFGFTVKRMSKGVVSLKKMRALAAYEQIEQAFNEARTKFAQPKCSLYIDPDTKTFNAYAVGSFMRRRVVITMGLLNHMHAMAHSQRQYVDGLRGVFGHEMSHLVNKDFLPGLLVSANDAANRHLSRFIRFFFMILIHGFHYIPVIGWMFAKFFVMVYNFIHRLINLFMRLIILPIYRFIQNYLSRSIEYRCDRQSAYAFGGAKVAIALTMLGKSGYLTIFSSHPKTKHRIKRVENIRPKAGQIKASLIARLTNTISISGLIMFCWFCGHVANIPYLKNDFFEAHEKRLEQTVKIQTVDIAEQLTADEGVFDRMTRTIQEFIQKFAD